MTEYEYTHNEQIMTYQWPEFFEELNKEYNGKPVSVERDGDLLSKEPPRDFVSLTEVKYYPVRTGATLYITTEQNSSAEKYVVKAPSLVWVVRDQRRRILAVQIIDEEGRNIILRFEP